MVNEVSVQPMYRGLKIAGSAALAVTLSAGLIAGAAQADSDGLTPNDCAVPAPDQRYRQASPATNTACVSNESGQFIFLPITTGLGEPTDIVAGFKIEKRGDVVAKVKFRFVRGKTVIVKYKKPTKSLRARVKQRFKKKGTWTVIATYKGQRLTAKLRVV